MEDDILDEELSIMYEDSEKIKVLDSSTFLKPIKNLKVRKPRALESGRSVQEAIDEMTQKHVSCLLITEGGALVGILTERDILKKVIGVGKGLATMTVDEIMTPNPETFQPDDSISFIINAMHVGGYRHVPIVNEQNEPIAMVSAKDIISFIAESFPEEVLNLPPHPIRKTGEREGA